MLINRVVDKVKELVYTYEVPQFGRDLIEKSDMTDKTVRSLGDYLHR